MLDSFVYGMQECLDLEKGEKDIGRLERGVGQMSSIEFWRL